MVDLLLARGADPNGACACAGGENPVWVAASQNDSGVLTSLLRNGAQSDRPAFAGLTPIDVATLRGYGEVVTLLSAAGAQPPSGANEPSTNPVSNATGIRAVDLWCPLPTRGLIHLAAGYRLGAIVLLTELSWLAARRGERVVWTGFLPRPVDLGDVHHGLADAAISDDVTVALALPTATDEELGAAFHAGVRAADEGGLLVVFTEAGHLHVVDEQMIALASRPGLTIVVGPLEDPPPPPSRPPGGGPYLAAIEFDEQRAARGRWPAISSRSWSTVASPDMAELADRARAHGTDALDRYLSQPFHVTSHITAMAGESTDIDELRARVAELVDEPPMSEPG